jgi:hypothetical protein
VVPSEFRQRIFITIEVIIPAGARCCPNHLQRNIESLNPVANITNFDATEITELINSLKNEVLRCEKARLDIDNSDSLTDSEYRDLLRISKDSFNDLLQYIEGKIRATPTRTTRTSLAFFFAEIKRRRVV